MFRTAKRHSFTWYPQKNLFSSRWRVTDHFMNTTIFWREIPKFHLPTHLTPHRGSNKFFKKNSKYKIWLRVEPHKNFWMFGTGTVLFLPSTSEISLFFGFFHQPSQLDPCGLVTSTQKVYQTTPQVCAHPVTVLTWKDLVGKGVFGIFDFFELSKKSGGFTLGRLKKRA